MLPAEVRGGGTLKKFLFPDLAVACSGFVVAESLTAENPNIVYRNFIIIIIIFVDLKICPE